VDLVTVDTAITPVTILREQAALLTQKTKGLVEGKVVAMPVAELEDIALPTGCEFKSRFLLRVPALDNYRYVLLEIFYPIEGYPMIMVFTPTRQQVNIGSQQEFYQQLGYFLSCDKTIGIIRALIAQVKS